MKYAAIVDSASTGESIGKVGQTTLLQFDSMNEYAVEVAAGTDPLGMLCFAIAAEQIRDDRKRNNSAN